MADTEIASTINPMELLATGRRHLAVKDFSAAAESLAEACEALAKEHGDLADQCAEAYLWYGKSLLGLSREESGVLGDGVPGGTNEEDDDDQEENGEDEQNSEAETVENGKTEENREVQKTEPESTSKDDKPIRSKTHDDGEPGPSNGDGHDESVANLENEDDVDNLQLAWEMLDLSRNILHKRVQEGGGEAARALLADVHLALGEVALESETFDKAVIDMQSCLELQKELYRSDDRRIAETHYQIGLANSLASNFEEAITHFKNAANILETRISTLQEPGAHKHARADPAGARAEIQELKELLPEIQVKIQDMMDYKAETIKRVREALCSSNGGSSNSASAPSPSPSSSCVSKPATNISHLVKRKRKASESDEGSAPKKANT